MRISVRGDVTPCSQVDNRRFGSAYRLHHQGEQEEDCHLDIHRDKKLKPQKIKLPAIRYFKRHPGSKLSYSLNCLCGRTQVTDQGSN